MTECARHRPPSGGQRLGAALEQPWGSHHCALLSPLLCFSSPTPPAAGLGDSVLFHHTRDGFLDGPVVKETTSQCRRPRFNSFSGTSPGGGNGSHSTLLPGESHGQRSYSPLGRQEWDTTEHSIPGRHYWKIPGLGGKSGAEQAFPHPLRDLCLELLLLSDTEDT